MKAAQAMERKLGPNFTLAAYHKAVLEPGAVPVKYLPEIVGGRLKAPGTKPQAPDKHQ